MVVRSLTDPNRFILGKWSMLFVRNHNIATAKFHVIFKVVLFDIRRVIGMGVQVGIHHGIVDRAIRRTVDTVIRSLRANPHIHSSRLDAVSLAQGTDQFPVVRPLRLFGCWGSVATSPVVYASRIEFLRTTAIYCFAIMTPNGASANVDYYQVPILGTAARLPVDDSV